jgi:hypothetical protein
VHLRTGLVLGQPLFNSHQRLILIGAEPLDLALPQAAPLQTDNIGSSQAALIVLYADTLEPVCKIPSENVCVCELCRMSICRFITWYGP